MYFRHCHSANAWCTGELQLSNDLWRGPCVAYYCNGDLIGYPKAATDPLAISIV
jgi:hypothetical protein